MGKGKSKDQGGRPTRYKTEYCEQAFKLCLLGATDAQLSDFFKISEKTLCNWKKKYPKFLQALKDGKAVADAKVAVSLYERAIGYSHPEDKIFNNNGTPLVVPTVKHYPPDTTAGIFWLKNRNPTQWRDKREIKHGGRMDVLKEIAEEIDGTSKGLPSLKKND